MKKLILLIIVLCWGLYHANAQKHISAYEYWFDNDYADMVNQTISPPQDSLTLANSINVSTLQDGLHVFRFHCLDDSNVWSATISQFFFKSPTTNGVSQKQITAYEYWFDNDYTDKTNQSVTTQDSLSLVSSINITAMQDGLHVFRFRCLDNTGVWSATTSQFIFKIPTTNGVTQKQITTYEYWFDNDYADKTNQSVTSQDSLSLVSSINITAMQDGLHVFRFRCLDNTGIWSATTSQFIFKTSTTNGVTQKQITAYEYWFDNDYADKTNQSVSSQDSLSLVSSINITAMQDGLHVFRFRCLDNTGIWSATTSQFIFKSPTTNGVTQKQITAYEYWFDNDYTDMVNQSVTTQDSLSLVSSINITAMQDGLHVFRFRCLDNTGIWSATTSQFIFKSPTNNGVTQKQITAYEYWFDNDYADKTNQSVTTQDSLSLVSSINITAMQDGLHVFRFRCLDNTGIWSATTSQFIFKTSTSDTVTIKQITAYEYWFDTDYANKASLTTTPQDSLLVVSAINLASLLCGEHIFHFRCEDNTGVWSASSSDSVIIIRLKRIELAAMFQEYYNTSTGIMNQTQGINWDTGDLYNNFDGSVVDTLTVLIRKTNVTDPVSPCSIDTAFYGQSLNVDGTISPITFIDNTPGGLYIVIKHRNSIETWSDIVDFSTDTITYNFFTHISQFALDGGMYIDNNNLAYIWGGDVNQNGNLESEDATEIYVSAISEDETVNNGYVINDVDGNGNIDSQDYGLAYSNALIGANVINPFSYQK